MPTSTLLEYVADHLQQRKVNLARLNHKERQEKAWNQINAIIAMLKGEIPGTPGLRKIAGLIEQTRGKERNISHLENLVL